MRKAIFGCAWLLLICAGLNGQNLHGVVRGTVQEVVSANPLSAVSIRLTDGQKNFQLLSDSSGSFVFRQIPVGRYEMDFQLTGFATVNQTEVLVTTAREVVLEIELRPAYYQLDEVILSPAVEKGAPRNQMALVSAISFDVEETRRYAGGLDDPTRLAANLAGVSPNPFISDNMISVRGNSPRGLQYRVEGVDIPNPNHFARIGSSGGSFTIFSNQVLARSDFLTSAFPAEYGNATAGVFDIQFRKGNSQKNEYTVQAGVLGIDLAAEGPLTKNKNASFLVNYRFFSLNLIKLVIDYPTATTYQDLSFKLHLPTKKAGTFSLFGMGGISDRPKLAERDPADWERDLDRFENVLASDMGIIGLRHQLAVGKKTVWQTAIAGSYAALQDNKDYLDSTSFAFLSREVNQYQRIPITFTSSLQHQFSPRHSNKTGLILTHTWHDYFRQKYDFVEEELNTEADARGSTTLFQAYTQSQFQLSQRWILQAGVHFLHFFLNDQQSVEPRLALRYRISPRHHLSIGYGRHSRVEHFGTYLTRQNTRDGSFLLNNQQLDLIKADHYVISFQGSLTPKIRIRLEAYYQGLFDVPVEVNGTYSVVNLDELNQLRVLENTGSATNKGIDLGIERYLSNGWYAMFQGSLFDSQYTDGQGNQYSTAFDLGYKANILAGKEWKTGKKKGRNNLQGANVTFSFLGGQPYTPIDVAASIPVNETVLLESQPFSERDPGLFIVDLTWTITKNHPKYTGTWAFMVKNLFQSQAPEYRTYDGLTGDVVELKGAAIIPVISYKAEF
ncbi:MAG: TonB-dependent receptor [Bacteroidota bacterium]